MQRPETWLHTSVWFLQLLKSRWQTRTCSELYCLQPGVPGIWRWLPSAWMPLDHWSSGFLFFQKLLWSFLHLFWSPISETRFMVAAGKNLNSWCTVFLQVLDWVDHFNRTVNKSTSSIGQLLEAKYRSWQGSSWVCYIEVFLINKQQNNSKMLSAIILDWNYVKRAVIGYMNNSRWMLQRAPGGLHQWSVCLQLRSWFWGSGIKSCVRLPTQQGVAPLFLCPSPLCFLFFI